MRTGWGNRASSKKPLACTVPGHVSPQRISVVFALQIAAALTLSGTHQHTPIKSYKEPSTQLKIHKSNFTSCLRRKQCKWKWVTNMPLGKVTELLRKNALHPWSWFRKQRLILDYCVAKKWNSRSGFEFLAWPLNMASMSDFSSGV